MNMKKAQEATVSKKNSKKWQKKQRSREGKNKIETSFKIGREKTMYSP